MNHEDVFYGPRDAEVLYYTEKNEAIEMMLDSEANPCPKIIELCKFKRRKVFTDEDEKAQDVLDVLLEFLHENYGGEDPNDQTIEMLAAAKRFVRTTIDEYVSWQCEIESFEQIDTLAWVREHADRWLVEGMTFAE